MGQIYRPLPQVSGNLEPGLEESGGETVSGGHARASILMNSTAVVAAYTSASLWMSSLEVGGGGRHRS